MEEDLCCHVCRKPAVAGEQFFLDYGEKNQRASVFRVGACNEHVGVVRDKVVNIFTAASGMLVAGSLFHLYVDKNGPHTQVKKLIIWSDCKNAPIWKKAWRVWVRTMPVDYSDNARTGQYRKFFGSPQFVNRYDWRGWNAPEKYQLQTVENMESSLDRIASFVREWIHNPGWEPQVQHGFPTRKNGTRYIS